jgi:fatty-acyl-CoA synthase
MNPINFSRTLYTTYQEIPEKPAVYILKSGQPDLKYTYSDLFLTSLKYTFALKEANIQSREVVILILEHGVDLVTAFLGAILGGAIPSIMPFLTEKLSPEKYRQSLVSLLEITKPAAIITYPGFKEEVKKASKNSSVCAVLDYSNLSENNSDPHHSGSISIEDLEGFHLPPQEIVLLQHSSGTTGLQKGVALSYQAIFNQLVSYSKAIKLNNNDVVVSWLPLYHDMGLIAGFIMPIAQRIPLVLMSPFDWVRAPHRLLQAISNYKGTLCWLPNFAYNFSAQKIRDRDIENVELDSLRAITNCSEPMYWQSHQLFLERFRPYGLKPDALTTSYAMAENVFAVTQGGIDKPVNIDIIDQNQLQSKKFAKPVKNGDGDNPTAQNNIRKMVSAGYPIEGTQIQILDAKGEELPERHIGEIAIHSNCLLNEYYHRPDLTEKAFHNKWFLTGDLGYIAGGELYITGRKKDLIIVGGKNIYPQDLENIVSNIPSVHPGRVVAFGIYNEKTGTEDVVIIAETDLEEEKNNLSKEEFKKQEQYLSDTIKKQVNQSTDIALRYVLLVDKSWLLKTSSGKIARSANREKYLNYYLTNQ